MEDPTAQTTEGFPVGSFMNGSQIKSLHLNFHGRIIDHLGIQMYQSPVAAIAELIANAWDGDAKEVRIELPEQLCEEAEIVVSDDGQGLTFEECQSRYLNVGYDRRRIDGKAQTTENGRPLLGRKGIGKFAGFGIAEVIRVETVSKNTGEKTVFELDIRKLRGEPDGDYVAPRKEVDLLEYYEPDEDRKKEHGTVIRLKRMTLSRRPVPEQFSRSMARRFLLHQRVADFKIFINGSPLPESIDTEKIEFIFPRDYHETQKPDGLTVETDGWGRERLDGGAEIRWRFLFYKDTIDEEELRGISVFIRGKLAQTPFFFNLVGGLSGQQGLEYLSGQVEADYLDDYDTDVTATERQRINWDHPLTEPLLKWGQERVKSLLKLWKEKRADERIKALEQRLLPFTKRMDKFTKSEQKVIKQALMKIAGMTRISQQQFEELGDAILTAWEGGRLKELIFELAHSNDMSEERFLDILLEANVLTALHMAEAVKTKLLIIRGLEERIKRRDKENEIRNYIAENPWLISPEMETFRQERSVENLLKDIAVQVGMDEDPDWQGRIDLALASGKELVVIEFMRPDLPLEWEHAQRFERYILTIRERLRDNTGGKFERVTGYLVADKLNRTSGMSTKLQYMLEHQMWAMDWETLLSKAWAQWQEFMYVLKERAPEDERLQSLSLSRDLIESVVEAAIASK